MKIKADEFQIIPDKKANLKKLPTRVEPFIPIKETI